MQKILGGGVDKHRVDEVFVLGSNVGKRMCSSTRKTNPDREQGFERPADDVCDDSRDVNACFQDCEGWSIPQKPTAEAYEKSQGETFCSPRNHCCCSFALQSKKAVNNKIRAVANPENVCNLSIFR